MARTQGPMTAQIENFIRMEARGEDHATVLREIFGPEYVTDPAKKHAAECKMARWRKRDDRKAIWDDEQRIRVIRGFPRAVSRLERQIESDNDWIANKASNDMIALATKLGIVANDEQSLNVRIEGLPEIGEPDPDV